MMTILCTLNSGSGLRQLNDYLLNQSYIAGTHPVLHFSNAVKTLSSFHHNAEKYFSRTSRRRREVWWQYRNWLSSFSCRAELSNATHEESDEGYISRATLIWRAVKLPIYSVALVPLTVGSAAAYLQTGVFSARLYLVLLASSFFIITWLNLSNDVYDYDTGADENKKESVVNMVGSRTGTLIAAYALLALGSLGLVCASVEAGNIHSILLLAGAITCGYIYQCPPFRLSYHGLGEPLCFAAFGPYSTTAFYLLQGSTSARGHLPFTSTILSASVLVGFTTSLILFCSHFHQIEGDKAVRKFSPLVRLGTKMGSKVVKIVVTTLYSLLVTFGLSRTLPWICILSCVLTLPIGKLVVDFVDENHQNKSKIFMAKYYCVRLHSLFGAALAAGLVTARMISEHVPRPIFT